MFTNILKKLGYTSYQEYLYSKKWSKIKKKVYDIYGHSCYFCGVTKNLHIHHTRYNKKIMKGHKLQNLIPLCNLCHKEVHTYASAELISIRKATNKIGAKYNKKLLSEKLFNKLKKEKSYEMLKR